MIVKKIMVGHENNLCKFIFLNISTERFLNHSYI